MTRRHDVNRSFQGVGAGQLATVNMDVAEWTYHRFGAHYNTATVGGPSRANMEAELSLIELDVGGKNQVRLSAADLFFLNDYGGIPFNDGVVPFYFSKPYARTPQGEDLYAWHTSDVNTFTGRITIAGGATSPELKLIDTREPNFANPQNGALLPMGQIIKVRQYNLNPGAAGKIQWNAELNAADGIMSLHFRSALVTEVEVKRGSDVWWKFTKAEADAYLQEQGKVPQAGAYHIDFAAGGRIAADRLPLSDRRTGQRVGLTVDVTVSGAGNIPILAELVGQRD